MSNNLNGARLSGGQANPETTANDGLGRLDAALTETFTQVLTSDATIGVTDYESCLRILVSTTAASKKLTLRAQKKLTIIDNQGANQIAVKMGTTELTLNSGSNGLFYTDGTSNGLIEMTAGTAGGTQVAGLEFTIDGNGSTLTTGVKGYWEVPFAITLTEAVLLADVTGSIVVDIWKTSYSSFDAGGSHPVSADKITASAPPTISSATKSKDSTLTGWTLSLSAGDIIALNINSVTSVKRVTLSLKGTR